VNASRIHLQSMLSDFLLDIGFHSCEYSFTRMDNYSAGTKLARQRAIAELVEKGPVASQDKLQRALAARGFKVGQATLSRDIHDLRLVKTAEGYALAGNEAATDPGLPPVQRLVREFVLSIRPAQNLLVLKTAVGSAQPVAAALDGEEWPEVVGTIAGDDAILIVSPDRKAATRLAQRIRRMLT
jgi:transcriptional regulator of arginine metabolism